MISKDEVLEVSSTKVEEKERKEIKVKVLEPTSTEKWNKGITKKIKKKKHDIKSQVLKLII